MVDFQLKLVLPALIKSRDPFIFSYYELLLISLSLMVYAITTSIATIFDILEQYLTPSFIVLGTQHIVSKEMS